MILCECCKWLDKVERPATKSVEFSGTSPRKKIYFDHAILNVCDEHFEKCNKDFEPDEVTHKVTEIEKTYSLEDLLDFFTLGIFVG